MSEDQETGKETGEEPLLAAAPTTERLFLDEKITLVITLLPLGEGNTNPGEREVLLGIRNGNDPPLFGRCRWEEVEELPPVVAALLLELKALLPARLAERKAGEIRAVTKVPAVPTPRTQPSNRSKPATPDSVLPATSFRSELAPQVEPDQVEQPQAGNHSREDKQLTLF